MGHQSPVHRVEAHAVGPVGVGEIIRDEHEIRFDLVEQGEHKVHVGLGDRILPTKAVR